jgi:hypothetical protein
VVLGAWKHYLTCRLMILSDKKSNFGPFQPIFPPETIKIVLYYSKQNVPPVFTVMLPSPPSVSWNWKCCLDSVLSAGTFLTIISTSEPLMRVTSCPSSSPEVSTVTALQFWTPSWLHWTRLEASLVESSVTRN